MPETVTEIRHRVLKSDQVFDCELFRREEGYVVLRYVNETDQQVDKDPIPAGSTTLAHYEHGKRSVWWEMFDPDKDRIGDLVHLSSPVQVRESAVEYTDLLLDIWHPVGGQPRLLDEDELVEAVEWGALKSAQARQVRLTAGAIMIDMPGHAPKLWYALKPEETDATN